MILNLINNSYYINTSFSSRRINISKEQILELRARGLAEKDIVKELGISIATYYDKLKKLGLPSKIQQHREKMSNIPKDEFEQLLKNKTPIEEICKIYNITTNAYYDFIEKAGLRKYIVGASKKAVTKDQLQKLVDQNIPRDEICEQLNIGIDAYFELLQKFNIATAYKNCKKRISEITKNQLENLINSGKSNQEISDTLGISLSSLQALIAKFQIKTKFLKAKENIANVTKEQLESLINSGKSVDEICKELNITPRTYTDIRNRLGIMTDRIKSIINIKNIKKEQLQELVDSGYTVDEICKKLNITQTMFYKLIKRYHVRYNYKNHANEIYISNSSLQKIVNEWTSAEDIERKLNVSTTAFYDKSLAQGVKTLLRDNLTKIGKIDVNEMQRLLNNGISWREICKIFDITPAMYKTILRRADLMTPAKKQRLNVQSITKEQLENLIASGKSTKEICKELNISTKTYIKKLRNFGLKTKD